MAERPTGDDLAGSPERGSGGGDGVAGARAVFTRRIEFADTDLAGIAHFARFFVFMETAEHRLREALGFPVHGRDADGTPIGWPRVAASCDYRRPVRFGDEVAIEVEAAEVGSSSVTFAFTFRHAGERVAEGRMTTVCCRLEPEVRPVPLPPELAARLRGERGADSHPPDATGTG